MKFIFSIISLLLCFSSVVNAAQLGAEQALKRAGLVRRTALKSSGGTMQLKKTVADSLGNNLYYVYSNAMDGRLYFVSADDCARPLLGYTDGPVDFETDSLPLPMSLWLNDYAKQISLGIQHPEKVVKGNLLKPTSMLKSFQDEFPSVDVLLPAEWGNKPFNGLCPKVDTSKTLVGCVALAMFQVMNYYQYPQKGRDTVMYATTVEGKDTVLKLDLSHSVYDWEALKDLDSDAGKATAAVLGRDCAYTVRASFGLKGTSAKSSNIAKALVRYFDYDSSMVCVGRSNDNVDIWFRILYNELSNARPVVYSANGSYGHAFVCDGYNATDTTFHFNWSWYGKYNGYYALSALNPGPDVFDQDHMMVIGIQPPGYFKKGTDHVFAYGDLTLSPNIEKREGCHTLSSLGVSTTQTGYASVGVYFAPPVYPTAQAAIRIIDDNTNDTFALGLKFGDAIKSVAAVYDYGLYIAFSSVGIDNAYSFLTPGSIYTASLMYRDFPNEPWRPVVFPKGGASSAKFAVGANGMLTAQTDAAVAPMLQTYWNVDNINFYCPAWMNGNRCGAGYDATAIGQIIYALKAPNRVFGDIHYDDISLDTLNYQITFSDTYVAPDVPYIGKAIRTKYGKTSAIHSASAMVYGLRKNMGLANCNYLSRKFVETENWMAILHNQLRQACPVYYCGYHINGTDSTRRAFVVDGFKDDSCHVNFGDGGNGDKYVDIDVINRTGEHPGNTDVCMAHGQGMLINFLTSCSIDSVNLPQHPFMLMAPLVVNGDSALEELDVASGDELTLSYRLTDCTAENKDYSNEGSLAVGVGLYRSGKLASVLGETNALIEKTVGEVAFKTGKLMAGTYELALVTKTADTKWERVYHNAVNSIAVSVKNNGKISLSIPFNPTFGGEVSLDSVPKLVTDSVKGTLLRLPFVNNTRSHVEDGVRMVVTTLSGNKLESPNQPITVYGNTRVTYDLLVSAEMANAIEQGGRLQVFVGGKALYDYTSADVVASSANAFTGAAVYTASGVLLKQFETETGHVERYLNSLPVGVYVVKCGGVSKKVVVGKYAQ
ncbi:MAG: C10 family peptidase [Paludibacteraceae bacterium]|nr:C10 family peptidase [Paludibacteraceae bacterium]